MTRRLALPAVVLAVACASRPPAPAALPEATSQLVVVTTESWADTAGELRRYERREDAWQPVGEAIPVRVGRNGMGWGRGLHPADPGPGPLKSEGDGRSPAGLFRLPALYGLAEEQPPEAALPFFEATEALECVDDPESDHYNTVLERTGESDWHSSERMLIPVYRITVLVEHNTDPPQPGSGSCIFFHVWEGPDMPTSGCTAMEVEPLRTVARWLRQDASPLLLQLPRPVYESWRESWGLPQS